jgi:ribosomal-protein-alanine N-acetyltransferase
MSEPGPETVGVGRSADWIIEPIQPALDLDRLIALEHEAFTCPWTREMFTWEFENSDVSHVFVLRTPTERVAAFCSCWLIFDELHINNVAVRLEWRRRGLATALLEHVIRDCAARGARRATLEVRRSNQAARRLYERLGFTVRGERARYYRNPEEDALVLWRDGLAGPS